MVSISGDIKCHELFSMTSSGIEIIIKYKIIEIRALKGANTIWSPFSTKLILFWRIKQENKQLTTFSKLFGVSKLPNLQSRGDIYETPVHIKKSFFPVGIFSEMYYNGCCS